MSDGFFPEKRLRFEGLKYFQLVDDLMQRLHGACEKRDRAGNRDLHYDQYSLLLLFYFFNPTITSLRPLRQATLLEKVQKVCGVKDTSLGSLSEAANVFDPKLLEPIIAELAARTMKAPGNVPETHRRVFQELVAVDGTLLKALPRMAWALWQDAQHRAVKVHVAFAVVPGVPVDVSITHGSGSERDELKKFVKPGGFYVADRGYANNAMFRDFDAKGVQFLIRVQENTSYEVLEERVLSSVDKAAGVLRDVTVKRLGTEKHNALLERPLRIVQIQGSEPDQIWTLATNAHHLSPDLIGIAYRYRWQVELFFRWFKSILGCRHLLSQSESGVMLQVYSAIIATLMISLWSETKPNKRTYEMICHYLNGWATEAELTAHLEKMKNHPP